MTDSDRRFGHLDLSHQKLGHQESGNQDSAGLALGEQGANPVDFDFLAAQTFQDVALEREVLALFVEQARRLLPTLPNLSMDQQSTVAHLLKGSARGIGAGAVAEQAALLEAAEASLRPILTQRLAAAFEHAETAILVRLAKMREAGAA